MTRPRIIIAYHHHVDFQPVSGYKPLSDQGGAQRDLIDFVDEEPPVLVGSLEDAPS